MALIINKYIFISLLLIQFSFSKKDINSFSNHDIIKQTNVELNFKVDFKNKVFPKLR